MLPTDASQAYLYTQGFMTDTQTTTQEEVSKHQASDDKAYRDLFSHYEIIQELIAEFIPPEIAQRLDLSALTLKAGQYITPLNKERIQDLVWSTQLLPETPDDAPQEIYLYLLLEFQTSDDKSMPLRMAFYTLSFYQHLIKHEKINLRVDKLPLVFPIVLYNGDGKWRTPKSLAALYPTMPSFLKKYQVQQNYYLIDEQRLDNQHLKQSDTFLSSIFDIEQAEDIQAVELVLEALKQKLKSLPKEEAQRHTRFLTNWINNHLLKNYLNINLRKPNLLEEEAVSLRKYLLNQIEQGEQRGLKQGIEKGRFEALKEAVLNLHRNMQWAADKIAAVLQLPIETVEHILANEQRA